MNYYLATLLCIHVLSSTCLVSMFIILSWFGIIFNLIQFALRGILTNTVHADLCCTTSSTDRSKLPKHSVFGDTQEL
jgi:hypothetical protein